MDETAISDYITQTFDGVDVVSAYGSSFFMTDPEGKFPLATLVTSDDDYDQFSNLNRPGVFRLNIGLGRQTFQSMFGADGGGYDYTALNQFFPHPVYGKMYWVSILNPTAEKFEAEVKPLLAEAYELSVNRYGKRSIITTE